MSKLALSLFLSGICLSHSAASQEWKKECVGYYQLELPDNLEVALYPVNDFINPRNEPVIIDGVKIQRYAYPGITFDTTHYRRQKTNAVQAQFSEFYYGAYELRISSESKDPIDFSAYQQRRQESSEFGIDVVRQQLEKKYKNFKNSVISEEEFNRMYGYILKQYPFAFALYESTYYTFYINKDNRLYHFWKKSKNDKTDKSQSAEKQWRENEPEVLSLLSRFRPRKLYEVPAEQGFCMPYGFIAGDSGHEKHNMAVTYRLKDHPDVTIFFQDLGMEPEAGFHRPDNETSKEFVTYLWNRRYQWSAISKELIPPKWRAIKMGGHEGLGTYVKSEFENGSVDYGYVAYVRGDHKARNYKPDLLLYVMQDSDQLNDQPPMDKDELEKMAEHIVSTIKRR